MVLPFPPVRSGREPLQRCPADATLFAVFQPPNHRNHELRMPYYGKPPVPVPGSFDFTAYLAQALGTPVENRYYKNNRVNLDGYTFKNCCFHNCVLITSTGIFSLQECTIANCTVEFGPNLVRAIGLYNWALTVMGGGPVPPSFHPKYGNDGAVSLP